MPRVGLTPARVVEEAARIADARGLDTLSLATLAEQLGVRVPSLYKHVGGLPDLQRRLALEGTTGLDAALRDATVGRSGGAALRACADAYRRYAREHPGRYAAMQRAPGADDPADAELARAAERLTGLLLAVLQGYGLAGADALHSVRAVRSALHGFCALEALGGFGLPYDVDESWARLLDLLDAGLVGAARGRGRRGAPPGR